MSSSPQFDLRNATVYFGYGSNLWRKQMRQRCPTSEYRGIARLKGYQWIIYDRGYANIVEIDEEDEKMGKGEEYEKEVWGLVYTLEKEDERRLDVNEGVPIAYKKEWIECEFWESTEDEDDVTGRGKPDPSKKARKVDMLVYIDRDRVKESTPKKEYVYRMNMGIKDALEEGVPRGYVERVMRRSIPETEDEEVRDVAWRQALEFEDER